MSEQSEHRQLWLVDRTITEKPSLINLTYATTDGLQYCLKERAVTGADRPATFAGITAGPGLLAGVEDAETRAAYAAEASRMAKRHDPQDMV